MPFFLIFLLALFLSSQPSFSDDSTINWKEINSSGLYKKGDANLIARNIWEDYTQEKALETLSLYPTSLHSPAYRSVVKKILLADSNPLKDDSIDEPELLSKRLSMLIQYGLFEDATALYNTVPPESRGTDFGLSFIGLMLTLSQGDLAPACLDIQASEKKFRDMPRWREISQYCNIRFGEKTNIKASDLKFKLYPTFNDMLSDNLRVTPASLSLIETLVAFADNEISRSLYDNAAKDIAEKSDLFVSLALNDKFKTFETYQCFAIEAIQRGIITAEELSDYYNKMTFNDDDLNGTSKAIKIHPCNVPAFFYQRFTKSEKNTIDKDNLNAFFIATETIPLHALTPFVTFFNPENIEDPYLWRAGTLFIMTGTDLPENLKNQNILIPLRLLQDSNHPSESDAEKWIKAAKEQKLFDFLNLDPASFFYYLRILSGDFSNFDKKKDYFNYENLFSLTYTEKSLHSGLGKIDAMSSALRNNDVVRLFMLALSQASYHKPNTLHPNEVAGILSSFHELKLKKEKDMLAIDAMHH